MVLVMLRVSATDGNIIIIIKGSLHSLNYSTAVVGGA